MDTTNIIISQRFEELTKENHRLKSKILFSIGALEGIKFLLKNTDPSLSEENMLHLRSVVDRVVEDLRKED